MKNKELKKCKYCASEIPKEAKICPICKKDVSNNLLIGSIFLIILVIWITYSLVNLWEDSNNQDKCWNYKEYISNCYKVNETENATFIYWFGSDWKELTCKIDKTWKMKEKVSCQTITINK